MPLVVYKLGGSLLSLGDLDRRLSALLQLTLAPSVPFGADVAFDRAVLVGGGETADLVRRWDREHTLGAERSHDLALAAMTFNARLVQSLVPGAQLVSKRASIHKICARGGTAILDPAAALVNAEKQASKRLPRSWDVTSDSIAAYLAIEWKAAGLVLIKSTPRPASQSVSAAVRRKAVDKYFPQLAKNLPFVAWVNLRAKRPVIERWL